MCNNNSPRKSGSLLTQKDKRHSRSRQSKLWQRTAIAEIATEIIVTSQISIDLRHTSTSPLSRLPVLSTPRDDHSKGTLYTVYCSHTPRQLLHYLIRNLQGSTSPSSRNQNCHSIRDPVESRLGSRTLLTWLLLRTEQQVRMAVFLWTDENPLKCYNVYAKSCMTWVVQVVVVDRTSIVKAVSLCEKWCRRFMPSTTSVFLNRCFLISTNDYTN